ncbi:MULTISPECIES: sensor domain-containing diguanylate cyclase [unclassified Arsukibacterium]|uniref:sensor domain-containing diguanylate cyclase n=1 Tax=unclassified Arsukibacterium TaxID=2635278 RepID=UPI000C5184A8|nr:MULTISPECIES: sensor domain-containing diguanylate cyclase [unclassified Arsukibacterium]MAA93154.1 GGDEF domain-containing protein [Rheinheimera sp.]MBM33720.1 GGDEF domain-containing protein [Rheinheimera sp.]HAW91440.1 GGDEF domain-containing protein [Candidatus Azambacteria bacterium]|tara:strand:- start:29859 stop:31142 length:1284 start_codon:yes stop_codon:yes gene_type:complete
MKSKQALLSPTKPRHSLVRKLTRQNLTVLLGSMLVTFALIAIMLWLTARERQGSAAELAAIQLASNVSAMLVFNDPAAAEYELEVLAKNRDLSGVALYNADGELFANLADVPTLHWQQMPASVEPVRRYQGLEIALTVPVVVQDNIEGVLYVRENLHQLMNWFLRGLLMISMLMAVIYWFAARLLISLQRKALSPLIALSALAEQVAGERNFSLRASVVNDDEIGSLTQRFNELLKRAEIWQAELSSKLQQQAARGDELEHLAMKDSLTQLPNRHSFTELLNQMVLDSSNSNTMSALMFIDIDNFKFVNDNYGHDAGDEVLIEVSRRIQTAIRADDTLCRLGGDEFALLLPKQVTPNLTEQVCKRLLQKINQPIWVKNAQMPVTLSIGVALCPQHSSSAATLLQLADEAMYKAKRAGKNGYQIYSAD